MQLLPNSAIIMSQMSTCSLSPFCCFYISGCCQLKLAIETEILKSSIPASFISPPQEIRCLFCSASIISQLTTKPCHQHFFIETHHARLVSEPYNHQPENGAEHSLNQMKNRPIYKPNHQAQAQPNLFVTNYKRKKMNIKNTVQHCTENVFHQQIINTTTLTLVKTLHI